MPWRAALPFLARRTFFNTTRNKLETSGALVGPPWSKRQLGVVIRETAPGGASLYYEPHCDFTADSVKAELAPGDVDVVVTPVVNQELGVEAVGYPLVRVPTLHKKSERCVSRTGHCVKAHANICTLPPSIHVHTAGMAQRHFQRGCCAGVR